VAWLEACGGKRVTVTEPSDSRLILVDSSGWIEYMGEGPKADRFAVFLQREDLLLVPTVVIYEVYKKVLRQSGRTVAMRFTSHALRGRVADFNANLATHAATLSLDHALAMADAIIYATAQYHHAELATADHHFAGLPDVTLI
jgi:predicted nucleic acid-binding protein